MQSFGTYLAHTRALLRLGLPLVGSNLAYVLIGVTDTLMLGWYSVEALAAQVIAFSYFFVIYIVGSGFGWAIMPMVAKYAEAGKIAELRRVTRMGLWASFAYGLVFLPALLGGGYVLAAIGQDPEIVALAGAYLMIVGWAVFPQLAVMTLRSYLSALERTQVVFWATVGGAALNAGLNWVLIFGNLGSPELGIRGAAIASLSMYVATVAALVIYVRLVEPAHQLFVRLWRIDRAALAQVVRLGWPIGLTSLAEASLFSASAVMMGWLGTIPLAAHGIALQLSALTFVVHLGLSNAATVRAGQADGRGDRGALRDGGIASVGLSLAMSSVAIVVFLTFPEFLSGLFIGEDEPERAAIIAAAVALLAVAAAFQTFDGLQVIGLGLLRGLEDTTVPMVYAVVAYWVVGMPVSYLLGFTLGLGGVGVWAGLVIGLAVAGILLIGRYWRRVAVTRP